MSTVVSRLPERGRQIWAATRLDFLRLSRGRFRMARYALIGLPVLASLLYCLLRIATVDDAFTEILATKRRSFGPDHSLTTAVQFMWPFCLRFTMFLAAIEVFGNLYRGELSERTLHHVFLQPLRRETITIGKFLAGVLTLVRAGFVAWLLVLLLWLIPHGPITALTTLLSATGLKMIFSFLVTLTLSMVAYGGLFLLAGMISRGAVMLGAGLWLWELLALILPLSMQRFTVSYWLRSFRPVAMPSEFALAQDVAPASAFASVIVCLAIAGAATATAAWWSRHLQLAYGAKD